MDQVMVELLDIQSIWKPQFASHLRPTVNLVKLLVCENLLGTKTFCFWMVTNVDIKKEQRCKTRQVLDSQ